MWEFSVGYIVYPVRVLCTIVRKVRHTQKMKKKKRTFCYRSNFLHNSTMKRWKISPSQEALLISYILIFYAPDHIGTARYGLRNLLWL